MRRGVVTLPAIIAVAAVIGWIAPFDLYYTALTGNSPVLRAAVIAALALLGGLAAQAAGLQLAGHGRHGVLRAPAGIGLAAAALVAGWCSEPACRRVSSPSCARPFTCGCSISCCGRSTRT
jgi:hypothetical protein